MFTIEPAVAEDLQPELAAVEHTREVHVDHGPPLLQAHLGDRPVAEDARVVDEHVEPAAIARRSPAIIARTASGSATSAAQDLGPAGPGGIQGSAASASASARVRPSAESG